MQSPKAIEDLNNADIIEFFCNQPYYAVDCPEWNEWLSEETTYQDYPVGKGQVIFSLPVRGTQHLIGIVVDWNEPAEEWQYGICEYQAIDYISLITLPSLEQLKVIKEWCEVLAADMALPKEGLTFEKDNILFLPKK